MNLERQGTEVAIKPVIQIRSLNKSFGQLIVIDDLTIDIFADEIVAIVGPTGCGKTTLLNLLSCLTEPTKGDIFINGIPADPRLHGISYVFQEPTCLPWRTVFDNVAYGLEIKRTPRKEIVARTNRMLELVKLANYADIFPSELSASMMQRIAVARAFAANPDLLLMDEPYGQLDMRLRFHLEDELIHLWNSLKNTVILVTHNIEEAIYVARRVIVLTNKPTVVKTELRVDLPYPRNVFASDFVALRNKITDLIRWW